MGATNTACLGAKERDFSSTNGRSEDGEMAFIFAFFFFCRECSVLSRGQCGIVWINPKMSKVSAKGRVRVLRGEFHWCWALCQRLKISAVSRAVALCLGALVISMDERKILKF